MVNFGGAKVQLFFNLPQSSEYFFISSCISANIGHFQVWGKGLQGGLHRLLLLFFLKKNDCILAERSDFSGINPILEGNKCAVISVLVYIYD